jgi:sugar (pentulose or hexulose) kinase
MTQKTVLAVDLGAESGRVMAVHYDGHSLQLEELHRFSNGPVNVRGTLYWDFLRLWSEIRAGVEKGRSLQPAGIGVDTWGVDFALLDRNGSLLGNPIHYRDDRTEGMMAAVFAKVPREEVFACTGIQFMRINTLYQIMSLVESDSPLLAAAETFLMAPDLINYWFTGTKANEYTAASTSQMLDAQKRSWSSELNKALGIPNHLFQQIVQPGIRLGQYGDIPVFATASHDTGSAVAAVPAATADYCYVSSGTWSLIGLEVPDPYLGDAALQANVTNEGGVYGTIRLLQNSTGLWIVQQCRKAWQKAGAAYNYAQLVDLARGAVPLESFINVNDPVFLPPGDHPHLVQDFCRRTGQNVPETVGEIIRSVLESLAFSYRQTLESLLAVSGREVEVVHIVGGGIQNELLNQMAANATGRPVVAGPIEATVIGNALVQLIAMGELRDLSEGRELVRNMSAWHRYEPQETAAWDEAYQRYQAI